MPHNDFSQFTHSWEEAIEILRGNPAHADLIFNSYLTRDLVANCERFTASAEFSEVLTLLARHAPQARTVLDMPAGNGIATYAFARAGFDVISVEPDASVLVGRGATEYVLGVSGLSAKIVAAWGEALPFEPCSFDVVYVRQGLHHARDLPRMLSEIWHVLRPGGLLLACREHVVDNYGESLRAFLKAQIDHQLYGGEYAFTLSDYRSSIRSANFDRLIELGPYDSIINAFPNTPKVLEQKVLSSRPGRLLRVLLPDHLVARMGVWYLKRRKSPGRMYSFLATKSAAETHAE